MPTPLVSIVIPTYKPTFLDKAIESALAQTYQATEILVSDQCPDDSVKALVSRYPDIRYHRNPTAGVYANFRNCIRIARGEYIKFLLDDDILEPDCVGKLVEPFQKYEDATLVCSWYRLIDDLGRETGIRRLELDRPLISSPGGGAPPMLISARNPIGPLTTSMFPKRALPLGIGPWFFHTGAPDRYFGLMDMAIILDLAFQGRVIMLPEFLSSMRIHDEQLSNSQKNPRAVFSIRSWLPLADDAYAFDLLTAPQHDQALDTIIDLYRRFVRMFPSLKDDIRLLEQRIATRSR